ncbi:amino acid adenylation domain-containing protein [Catellatospora sp. NPDC049609]|uniref:amino acid adenylation domain-containing protein n=1 Tax=Catellatospora sp. NPDC049609 TaxID=3155505 RepID=UPI00343979D1
MPSPHGPALDYPDRRFPDLVADRAAAHPDAPAVRQGDTTLTYGALCASAEALAARLPGPEPLVGVCADRRPPLVVALLGVLASGAGYVPLDPALPPARLREIAREAGLRTVVCDEVGARLFAESGLHLVPIPDAADEPSAAARTDGHATAATADPSPADALVTTDVGRFTAGCPAAADDLAYVMFTSGSTGRPKGVMIPHEALTEFVTSLAALAGLDRGSVCLGFASIGFDASVIDLLAPLAAGGTVALAGAADRADPTRLQRFCADHGVTVAFLPPAVLPILDPEGLPELRVVLTGSEAPGPEQVARWTAGDRRFLNLFGPTETTVLVTWFEATGAWDRPLPIGRPAANHRVHVVDEWMRPVGLGEPGELLAGGTGLALGYLGAPELTEERFVPDPFSGIPGARLYRTGDLVAWDPDGELRFIGRIDRQVKIRGQRVEIGEVEAVLRAHPAVAHAAVAAVDGPHGTTLVAFVTGAVTPEALRGHCAAQLPAATVPARIHTVPELPLLSSGKVDLDRLVATADGPTGEHPFVPPATPVEEQVAEVWAGLLGLVRVGRDDDFFDTGGHSITAMRLVAALRRRLARDVAVEDVLQGRTLRAIAARAQAAAALTDDRPVRGRPPALSPSQQRLWFLERYSPAAAAAYNIVLAERLRGPLDPAALQRALTAVAARQQVLRWRIPDADGVPYAVLDPAAELPLPVTDLSALPAAERERELAGQLAAEAARRFTLATDTLWRNRLFRLGDDEHVLAITAHHAVFDGWSQAPLYDDLAAAYAKGPAALPPLPATYADYVAWREQRRSRRADGDLDWWTSHLDGVPTVLEVPGDRPRPAEQTYAGGHVGDWLDAATTADLLRFAREHGATPSAVLLAAFGLVLSSWAGQDELVVGTPAVDRRDPDFEQMVGFFIDIMPLRLRTDRERGFADHVRAARDELIAALAHPEAPLERIVQAFGLGGQVVRSPLVQVLFNVFNFDAPRLDLAGTVGEPVPVPAPGSAFDLTLYGVQRAGRTRIEIVYNSDLYTAARMRDLLDALRQVIVGGLAAGDTPAAALAPPRTVTAAPSPPARRRAPRPTRVIGRPPATPTEHAVAAVWCDVLGLDAVGVTDNFFDSGGSSLAVATVQQRLHRLTGRELRVVDLFRHPTVRALAAHLDGGATGDGTDDAVEQALRRGAARRARHRTRIGTEGEPRG